MSSEEEPNLCILSGWGSGRSSELVGDVPHLSWCSWHVPCAGGTSWFGVEHCRHLLWIRSNTDAWRNHDAYEWDDYSMTTSSSGMCAFPVWHWEKNPFCKEWIRYLNGVQQWKTALKQLGSTAVGIPWQKCGSSLLRATIWFLFHLFIKNCYFFLSIFPFLYLKKRFRICKSCWEYFLVVALFSSYIFKYLED